MRQHVGNSPIPAVMRIGFQLGPARVPLHNRGSHSRNIASGKLEPSHRETISFTEIPIGELDRMNYRHHVAHHVAIGFPRRYTQSLGRTPVWYLKHNSTIRRALAAWKAQDSDRYAEMSPFIEETEDVAPFQEFELRAL